MTRDRLLLFAMALLALMLAGWYFWLADSQVAREIPAPSPAEETIAEWASTPQDRAPSQHPVVKPESSVSGHVTFVFSGEPAVGVQVEARVPDASAEPLIATTDELGAYSIVGLKASQAYLLVAEDPDRVWAATDRPLIHVDEGESLEGLDLFLDEGRTIRGKVTERDGQNRDLGPLAGIAIRASVDDAPYQRDRWEAITDSDGRYEINGLPARDVTVRAEPPPGTVRFSDGHYSQSQRKLAKNPGEWDNVNFYFRFDGVSIVGRVTDDKGGPIAGARIQSKRFDRFQVEVKRDGSLGIPEEELRLFTEHDVGIWLWQNQRNLPAIEWHAESDDEGWYRIDGLIPARPYDVAEYRLRGRLPGESTYILTAHAFGFVRREQLVTAIAERALWEAEAEYNQVAASMRGPEEAGAPIDLRDVPLPDVKDQEIRLDFVLEREAVVSGRVVDRRGDPQPGCTLTAGSTTQSIAGRDIAPPSVQTDHLGRFVMSGLHAGKHAFEVMTAGHIIQTPLNGALVVQPGDVVRDYEVVILTSEDLGSIEGTVRDGESGAPIPEFQLQAERINATHDGSPLSGRLQRSEESVGVYSLLNVSPGIATIEVEAGGYARYEIDVAIEAQRTTQLDVALQHAAVLKGHLVHAGEPVMGHVQLIAEGDAVQNAFTSRTDAAGYYRIDNLPEGTYSILATARDGDGMTAIRLPASTSVTLRAGEHRVLDIAVTGSASIRGTLQLSGENPYGHIYLRAANAATPVPDDPRFRLGEDLFAYVSTRDSGAYHLGYLEPGIYTITATYADYREVEDEYMAFDRQQISHQVELTQDQSLNLDFQF